MQGIDMPVAFDLPPEPAGIEEVHIGNPAVLDLALGHVAREDNVNWQDALNLAFDTICMRAGNRFERVNDVFVDETDGFTRCLAWRVA